MLKVVFTLLAALLLIALLTRADRLRRALWIALGVIAVYAVLKGTGAIEALAPTRNGVF